MHDVEAEPLFAERAAGIDIAKAGIEVTIRVPSESAPGRRQQETRSFATTRRQLLALADWLRSWGVTRAGMEATGDYWKPVYFVLEAEGFDCQLYHAGQVKALPGRPKTDRADSVWLARITERGSLPSSFVPPAPIRALRTHTRYRRHLTQARTAEKQRVEKLLEDAHLKLSSVISDIHGVSGRAMLEAIIAGQRSSRSAGPAGPRQHAPQDHPAGASPGLLLPHRRARGHPGHDAGRHRPLHRPDRPADRPDRGPHRALPAPDRPA